MAKIGIVPEELKEENYEFWKVCLKSYLRGQGLWDVISKEATPEEKATPEWQQKNAQALHAIQLACGSHAYSKYKKNTHVSAKFAWDHLAEMHPTTPSHHTQVTNDQDVIPEVKKHLQYEDLYNAVVDDQMGKVLEFLNNNPNACTTIVSSHDDTALHVAILHGNMKIALKLVEKMPPEGLEMTNEFGATPLSLAAITDKTKLAKAIVRKNSKLVTMKNGKTEESSLPVIVASMYGKKHMVRYLYTKTPNHLLDPTEGSDGVLLLNNLITADLFDVASMLLHKYPKLGVTADCHGEYALHKLAHKPSAFASGSKFPYWKQWIYSCVRIHSPWDDPILTNESPNASGHEIDIDSSSEEEFSNQHSFLHRLGWILLQFFVPDIKHLHDRKLVNDEASKLLSSIFKQIRETSSSQLENMEIDKAIHSAIKHGIVEFVEELLKFNPEFIWKKDKKGRTIFSHALILRQEKIFSLFYKLGTKKSIVASRHDIFRNNFLHLAAKLSPPHQLERVSGAALQMQRELQWYKEVESLVQPKFKEQVNGNNRKPSTLFTEEHKELAKEGEKWMKNTAGSSMIVGTLIAAVMFTTAFTVPGGNNGATGLPIMLDTDSNPFMIFTVTNGLSLFTSSTSVLMFLGILTARYAEDDFLVSLPTKLVFGIACLFFSIVTMMVSFAAALFLMLHKSLPWVSIPLIVLATFPVLLFSALQFPLLIEMVLCTYGYSIFDKPKKNGNAIKDRLHYLH
ncbi:hypothetical protein OSB04_005725 [Centaurea solstitialis]|uniref:PGG domain-containing protein n=1 Tax=Centaurea solstitialis TaxID=347529 RepID=A0AA38TGL3_9ASTR|nr:hypothetical protein OSB04_005725 [Centaurea solstitialis]